MKNLRPQEKGSRHDGLFDEVDEVTPEETESLTLDVKTYIKNPKNYLENIEKLIDGTTDQKKLSKIKKHLKHLIRANDKAIKIHRKKMNNSIRKALLKVLKKEDPEEHSKEKEYIKNLEELKKKINALINKIEKILTQ